MGIFTVGSYSHAPGMPPERAVFYFAPDPKCALWQRLSTYAAATFVDESPPRVDSVVWELIFAVAVTFIKEDSDDKAEDVECDDEEEAANKMGVIFTDDEAGVVEAVEAEDDAGIEGSIVGTYRYMHV